MVLSLLREKTIQKCLKLNCVLLYIAIDLDFDFT